MTELVRQRELNIIVPIVKTYGDRPNCEYVLDLLLKANSARFVSEFKALLGHFKVDLLTQLWTQNVPRDCRCSLNLLLNHVVLLEYLAILEGEQELSTKPGLYLRLQILALAHCCILWVPADLKCEYKLRANGSIVAAF